MSDDFENLKQMGIGEGFHNDLCQMLEKVQLLQDFDRGDIEALAQYCSAHIAPEGVTIFKEGEKSHFMCLLVKGRINILKEQKHVVTIRAGKSMGEMSILDGFPYSATAVSALDSELILFTRRKFDRLCQNDPPLALKLNKAISKLMSLRLRQTTGILLDYL